MADIFYEWDYSNDVCIAWEREGECNGCGQCCMVTISFIVANRSGSIRHDPKNGGLGTDQKGVWFAIPVGEDKYRYFKMIGIEKSDHRCAALTQDNRCSVHTGKPLLHRSWPMNPRQVTPFEQCSYTFRETARWSISKECR